MSDLARMRHADLYALRETPEAQVNQALQDLLAGYEHRAFARELTQERPLLALPMMAAVPAYQMKKLLGGTQSRSAPSLEQMMQGWRGTMEGLLGGR